MRTFIIFVALFSLLGLAAGGQGRKRAEDSDKLAGPSSATAANLGVVGGQKKKQGDDNADDSPFNRAASALLPVNQSGIFAQAEIKQRGDGSIVVRAAATGLIPGNTYVSLFYDLGSIGPRFPTAILLGTPAAPANVCRPGTQNPVDPRFLTFAQMVVGVWSAPDRNGASFLNAVLSGPAAAPINLYGTMSVRLDTQPGTPLPAAPDPNRFQIRACGDVVFLKD